MKIDEVNGCKSCQKKIECKDIESINRYLGHLSYNIEQLIERVDRIEPLVIDKKRLILNIDSLWNKIANIERSLLKE